MPFNPSGDEDTPTIDHLNQAREARDPNKPRRPTLTPKAVKALDVAVYLAEAEEEARIAAGGKRRGGAGPALRDARAWVEKAKLFLASKGK